MKTEIIDISKVKLNPSNPRVIKDDKFKKLVQSIISFPKMLEIRPIVVNNDMVVLGGNMRLRACQEAGLKQVPIIKAADLTPDQQREFIIKDNVGFGEWDFEMLANEWDMLELSEWGLDVPIEKEVDEPAGENKMGIYPLSIVLNAKEYKDFQLYKKENRLKTDTEAFKNLFENKLLAE